MNHLLKKELDEYEDLLAKVSTYLEEVNEPIDEEKLNELVHKHIDEWEDTLPKTIMDWADGFKAGYRKAKELLWRQFQIA